MNNWRKHTQELSLALDDCDLDDGTYLIPCFADLGALKESISAVGIIHKPLVRQNTQGKWVPVLGRRRLLAARKLGFGHVEGRVLDDEISEALAYEVAFWDNVTHRQFEAPTKAAVIHRLLQLFSREEVAARFLPTLGIPPYGPKIEALRRIAMLEPEVHLSMAMGRINEKTALMLSYLEPQDRRVCMNLFARLKLNANKTFEAASALMDMARFQGCSVQEVLNSAEIQEVLSCDQERDPWTLGESLRRALKRVRYPGLCAEEAAFAAWLREQKLPSNMTIRPSQAFEDNSCTIEIHVESKEKALGIVQAFSTLGD
ncbi:MAG: ParB/RepB/Spo0J family partition protein [Desulfomonilaceae bacterium]